MLDDITGGFNEIKYNYDDMIVKVDAPEWSSNLKSITENVNDITSDVRSLESKASDISVNVRSLEDTVKRLHDELEQERAKSDKIARNNKIFTIMMSFLSVLLSIGIPRFISWLERLLS